MTLLRENSKNDVYFHSQSKPAEALAAILNEDYNAETAPSSNVG